jgi:hypothetical protein
VLLKLLLEQKFLCRKHLLEGPFLGRHASVANRRMCKLIDAGLVSLERDVPLLKEDVFRLTRRGHEIARKHAPLPVFGRVAGSFESMSHDVLVTSLRLRLEASFPDAFWRAETTFRDVLRPDGILYLDPGFGIAFEVERSRKSSHRYAELLSRWEKTPSIRWLVYLGATSELERHLLNQARRYRTFVPVGVALFEDFVRDLELKMVNGQRVDFRDICGGSEAT